MDRIADLAAPSDGRQSDRARAIARGTTRLLAALDLAIIAELPLPSGRRADLVALGSDGRIWIIEIKSGLADFRSDRKWTEYRAHADRVLFAVAPDFPLDVIPECAGLIVADAHGAELRREGDEAQLKPATRKAILTRFARAAAVRLAMIVDPGLRDAF